MSVITSDYQFEEFETKCHISWMPEKPIQVFTFRYVLTQYTPSVYAKIILAIPKEDFNKFQDIEKLKVEDRKIEVYIDPELKGTKDSKIYFGGPWKFIISTYKNTRGSHLFTMMGDYHNMDSVVLVELDCVDRIFYKMKNTERFNSFGEVLISDIVKKLVEQNGGKMKICIPTDTKFRWIQTRLSDYQMVRQMLPFAKDTKGNLMYTFFMYNEEGYFAPIGNKLITDFKISVNKENLAGLTQSSSDSMKHFVDQYSSEDNIIATSPGFSDFFGVKPKKDSKSAYLPNKSGNKSYENKDPQKILEIPIENEKLKENYVSNYRKRIMTFSKILGHETLPLTECTPLDAIEVVHQENGEILESDGAYYIASIDTTFGFNNSSPVLSKSSLVLLSEVDLKGMKSAEGEGLNGGSNGALDGIAKTISSTVGALNPENVVNSLISNIEGIPSSITGSFKDLIKGISSSSIINLDTVAKSTLTQIVGNLTGLQNNFLNLGNKFEPNSIISNLGFNLAGQTGSVLSNITTNPKKILNECYKNIIELTNGVLTVEESGNLDSAIISSFKKTIEEITSSGIYKINLSITKPVEELYSNISSTIADTTGSKSGKVYNIKIPTPSSINSNDYIETNNTEIVPDNTTNPTTPTSPTTPTTPSNIDLTVLDARFAAKLHSHSEFIKFLSSDTVKYGSSNFKGNLEETIIDHGLGTTPKTVIITPAEYADGYLGEFYVRKDSTKIYVGNTGTATTKFDWLAIK